MCLPYTVVAAARLIIGSGGRNAHKPAVASRRYASNRHTINTELCTAMSRIRSVWYDGRQRFGISKGDALFWETFGRAATTNAVA